MKEDYQSTTTPQALAHLAEECGELVHAIGKLWRWGPDSVNPELPVEDRVSNMEWVLNAVEDVEGAIEVFRKFAQEEGHIP